jgi:hypothetical protein
MGEWIYRSTFSWPRRKLEVSSQLHGPRPLYPLDRRLGEPQNRSGRNGEEKILYLDSNSDPLVIQPIVSRYTIKYTSVYECVHPLLFFSYCEKKIVNTKKKMPRHSSASLLIHLVVNSRGRNKH